MNSITKVIDKVSDDLVKRTLRLPAVVTDSPIFRIYYKPTLWMVGFYSVVHLYCSLSVPISCIGAGKTEDEKNFIQTVQDYCWTKGTFSVRRHNASIKDISLYPGIQGMVGDPNEKIVVHHYYKWMYIFILIKLISLYLPRFMWRNLESGVMKALCAKLKSHLFVDDEEVQEQLKMLTNYFYISLGSHSKYAGSYIFCETLNVIVVAVLMYLWDYLSGYELSVHAFGALGPILMNKPTALRDDPLTEVFPILGKCTFSRYGASGNIIPHDFLCVLPINIVTERAAVLFWFFFMFLIAVGSGQILLRLAYIYCRRLRAYLLTTLCPFLPAQDIEVIIERCSYSDWFILYLFGQNVEPIIFRQLLMRLAAKLRGPDEEGQDGEEDVSENETLRELSQGSFVAVEPIGCVVDCRRN